MFFIFSIVSKQKLVFMGQSALSSVKCNSRHIFNQVVVRLGAVSDETLPIHLDCTMSPRFEDHIVYKPRNNPMYPVYTYYLNIVYYVKSIFKRMGSPFLASH